MTRLSFTIFVLALCLSGCGGSKSQTTTTTTPVTPVTPAAPTSNYWTWISGSESTNVTGTYGTERITSTSNSPGSRELAGGWADSGNNLWLFGGQGYTSSAGNALFNDLWEYSTTNKTWTWVAGSSSTNQSGTYGAKATAAAANTPGARYGATTWVDSSGVFWLFGGYGYDASGNQGSFNDLWYYSPASGEWTWENGSEYINPSGVYGTVGNVVSGGVPGGRSQSCSAVDASGDVWIFGGMNSDGGYLNDLWVYIPPSHNLWTWESGSNSISQSGTYGTKGTTTSTNVPGGRYGATCWINTSSGYMWVYGGYGMDSNGQTGYLNDLWKLQLSTLEWTWVSGSSTRNGGGTYGTESTAASGNVPGARIASNSWSDSSGNLWIFGGTGYDANSSGGYLNDLWEYSPSSGEWTWESGSNIVNNSTGVYGTQGTASTSNLPGTRVGSTSWTDSSGDLWLMGGYYNYSSSLNESGYLNDLWKYVP